MDLGSLTFVGLMTLGAVNVFGFFFPTVRSEYKFALSVLVAFGLTFVPLTMSNMLYDKIKIALEIAFAVSGGYKIAQKIGSH